MALVSTIVSRTLRLLNVIDASADTPALDGQTAIIALNAMCTRWEANGLALGWANVALMTDTLPAPDEAHEAISYNLAVRIGPEYALPAAFGVIVSQAQLSLAELRRDRLGEMPLTMNNDLPMSSVGSRWDIYNDKVYSSQ